MSDKHLIIQRFENMDKEGLIEAIYSINQNKEVVPVDEFLFILDETMDIEVILVIIECLLGRIDEVDDYLLKKYKSFSRVVQDHILLLFSKSERSKHMQFLLDEYFYNPYKRPRIRKEAFENKKFLFMNLARYFEGIPFNEDNVTIAQQILKTIPRDIILSCVGVFTGTKILDVYYAIPVNEREKFDQ